NLAKKSMPAVVNIYTTKIIRYSPYEQDELFRRFFEDFMGRRGAPFPGRERGPDQGPGQRPEQQRRMQQALGTGFIIDSSGIILTNNHVIAEADEVRIVLGEDEKDEGIEAKIIGTDPNLDVALLKIKTSKNLTALELGDSSKTEIGDMVIAIGNPFGLGHTVTQGIISATGRSFPNAAFSEYLQTDASINPGNSGGPLINTEGKVVGINNFILASGQGLGFAISINSVKNAIEDLKEGKQVKRGYIGIAPADLTKQLAEEMSLKDMNGVLVTDVTEGEPADKAGIKPYDVIIAVNDKSVSDAKGLIRLVSAIKPGNEAKIKVIREGKEMLFTATVRERPGEQSMQKRPEGREFSGMSLSNLTPDVASQIGAPKTLRGVVVMGIDYDSPAARVGVSRGDVIVEVNRMPVKDLKDFGQAFKKRKQNLLRIFREGVYRIVLVKER
ncbi:MAG: Do family serine endopeptidase, partial [Oligoflexales bacterium]|nr:Do family serine endopeptidase [Oligoflexales bacterium]